MKKINELNERVRMMKTEEVNKGVNGKWRRRMKELNERAKEENKGARWRK